MKVIYLGEIGNAGSEVESILDSKLVEWNPPDLEAPIWEFHFENDISAYTDGRLMLIVEGEENEAVNKGEKTEKVARMKRGGVSRDAVLENKE